MNRPKLHVWAERPDATQPWVWHYGVADPAGQHVDMGSSLVWRDAVSAAEWLLYTTHHAVPMLAALP